MVAIRLSILADDPPGYAGAGHLIQHLLFNSLRDQVERVGGRAEMERSADAIVYTVTGPARELDFLAAVLRGTLTPGEPAEGALLRASRVLAEERLSEWDVAEKHVRSALRVRLFPEDLSAAGTESSAARLTADMLPALWAEIYRPERVSVVAVGDVTLTRLEQDFSDLPTLQPTPLAGEVRDTVSLEPLAPAQATQGRFAVGYRVSDLPPAALSVTARLLQEELSDRVPGATASGEHWWTHYGEAVVVVASAPAPLLAATDGALTGLVPALAADLSPRRVRQAAERLRREMLFYGRTPAGMADLLGGFTDRTGDPDAAQEFYAALDRVDEAQVRAVLDALAAQRPARVAIPPQKLDPNG
jgi:predicted Zn-dependent peptidase